MSAPTRCRSAAWSGSPLALALLEKIGGKPLADKHRAQRNSASYQSRTAPTRSKARARRCCRPSSSSASRRYLTSQGRHHRRLGRSGAWRRRRQGEKLSGRLAQRRGQRRARRRGLRHRRLARPALLSRHGQGTDMVGAGRRLGRLVERRKRPTSSIRVAGWTEAQLAASARRPGLHLVRADDRSRRLRPAGVPAPLGHRRDRLDAPEHKSWERFRRFRGSCPSSTGTGRADELDSRSSRTDCRPSARCRAAPCDRRRRRRCSDRDVPPSNR